MLLNLTLLLHEMGLSEGLLRADLLTIECREHRLFTRSEDLGYAQAGGGSSGLSGITQTRCAEAHQNRHRSLSCAVG